MCSTELVPTANDNCVGVLNGTTTDPLSYNTQGTFTVTWTYDDGNGNPLTQTQTVVVDDTTAPVPMLASLPAVTGQCSATIATVPTANDNCVGVLNGRSAEHTSELQPPAHTVTRLLLDNKN